MVTAGAVVRVRPGEPTGQLDRYRSPILTPDVETVLRGVAFAPSTSTETDEPGRTRTDTAAQLFARGSVDLRRSDRVRVNGVEYDVAGDPAEWRHPRTGRLAGYVIHLTRTEG